MIPLIIESSNDDLINAYLSAKYYLANLVSEVIPENGSIGLPAIKFLIDRAKFAASSQSLQVFLIRSGQLITPAGQNALLKTLEESRPEEQFIITTPNHHLLLSTISSRCLLVRLAEPEPESAGRPLLELISALAESPASLIGISEKIAADQPTAALEQIISALTEANRLLPTVKRVKVINLAITAKNDIQGNVHPKLALDRFLFRAAEIIR